MSATALHAVAHDRGDERPVAAVDPAEAGLVARVLDGDTVKEDGIHLAAAVLATCGGIANLRWASRAQLVAAGLSPSQAARLQHAVALAARFSLMPPKVRRLERADAVAHFKPVFAALDREELHVLFLALDGTFRGRQRVASGGLSALVVHTREVLAPAVEARAPAMVLAHNHPSGASTPSPEDVAFTGRVDAAARVLGIRLVDHLVFGTGAVQSAMPNGARWPATAHLTPAWATGNQEPSC